MVVIVFVFGYNVIRVWILDLGRILDIKFNFVIVWVRSIR